MDLSEQIIDNMFIDMKRSNRSPYNPLQLYSCPLIRRQFYDHYNEVNRRSLPPIQTKTESIPIKSLVLTGDSDGPATFLIDRGNVLFNDECDYNSARVLFQQCYNFLCQSIGSTANLTLSTLYRLADSTRELGNYSEANSLYEQAVNQYLSNAGDRIGLAFAYYGWGESMLISGDYPKAKQYFQESLNLLKNQIQLGTSSVQTYLPEIGLIKLLIIECKWNEAIRQLDRLVNKVKGDISATSPPSVPGSHPSNLVILLAQIHLLLGRCKRGKGLYQEIKLSLDQAFVLLRQCVTEDHLYFGHALYELGEYYRIMGDIKLTHEKYSLALPIYESYYTTHHDIVYKCRTSIALYEYDLGHIHTSLNQHTAILSGREQLYGHYHPLIGETHLYLGQCFHLLGHYDLSKQHYNLSENLIIKFYHKEFSSSLYSLLKYSDGELERCYGYLEKSRLCHNEAMRIRREMFGKEHPEYIDSMQSKADLDYSYTSDSNMEEIVTLLKRILKLKKKLYLTDDHVSIAITLNTYGLVLRQQKKYHEALEKFHEALKLRLEIGDPNHYTIGEIRNNIALVQACMVEGHEGGDDDEYTNSQTYGGVATTATATPPTTVSHSRKTIDGKLIVSYDPKPPVEHYEGVTDITPIFINTKYRKAIDDMTQAIQHILITFPGTPQYQHPLIANIKGNIGLIERYEDEGKREFILRLTAKQRSLFREAEEKRLTEEYANMSADFSDASAGTVKLSEAIDYFHSHGYDTSHPWLKKFENLIIKNIKEIPLDAEPQNAQQLKANRKLLEARELMKKRLYFEAKKYYEETLQRLPDTSSDSHPDDHLSYLMTGECYHGLADIARIFSQLSIAKEYYMKSLSILKKNTILGSSTSTSTSSQESLQYADALLGYSDLLQLQGDYTQSHVNINEVILIKKRVLGERHESIIDCLFKRCVLLLQNGMYQLGFELCEYVLDARLQFPTSSSRDLTARDKKTLTERVNESTIGGGAGAAATAAATAASQAEEFDQMIRIAETYNLMAEYYLHYQNDYEKCEYSLQMTFKTCRKSVVLESLTNEDHMVLAESYHIKGLCRLKQHKFKDALRNFGHSLSMKMRLLNEIRQGRHPTLTSAEDSTNGGPVGSTSRHTQAMDPMEYSHVTIALSLYGQAEAFRQDGNHQIAADLYLKSIRLYQNIFQGEDNPAVAQVMFGQAENYRLFGKFENAEKIYQTVLNMRLRMYSSSNSDGTSPVEGEEESGNGTGIGIRDEGRVGVGVKGECHPDIADSYIGMGHQRYDQCRYQESLNYFEKALAIKRAIYSDPTLRPPLLPSTTAQFSAPNTRPNSINPSSSTAPNRIPPPLSTTPSSQTMTPTGSTSSHGNIIYENLEIGKIYLYLGMVQREIGNYFYAQHFFTLSYQIFSFYFLENHPVLCTLLLQQAKLYQIIQKYSDANQLLTLVISIVSTAHGESHPIVGYSVTQQSENQLCLYNYIDGKISAQRGLQIFNKIYGSEHPATIWALVCIAKSLYQAGKYHKSLPYFQRSYDFMVRVYPYTDDMNSQPSPGDSTMTTGGDGGARGGSGGSKGLINSHQSVAMCAYELGNCFYQLGNYLLAKEYYMKAYQIITIILSYEHQEALIIWSALGELEMHLGNLYDAEQIQLHILHQLSTTATNNMTSTMNYQKNSMNTPIIPLSLSLIELTSSLDDTTALPISLFQSTVMIRLGKVIEKSGKFIEAKHLYERCLLIQQQLLVGVNSDHPTVAETFGHLGRVLIGLGKYELAKGFYEKSSRILMKFYRENHPTVAYAVYGLAQCTRCLGYPTQAQGLYVKAINGLIRELGVDHPDYYFMLIGFAENRRDEGYIYPIHSETYTIPLIDFESGEAPKDPFLPPPNSSSSSAVSPYVCDLTNPDEMFAHIETCYAYPIIVRVYLYFYQRFYSFSNPSSSTLVTPHSLTSTPISSSSASSSSSMLTSHHYLILDLKTLLSQFLFLLGKFSHSYFLQKELLSLSKYHYKKEYQYMASVLFQLAEIERAMGKLSAKKKLYKGSGKPDLSVEALTGEKNRQLKTNKLRHQKMLMSSSQPLLPRIQSITERVRSPVKKRVLGYMGYQYPEIKTNEMDPSSPLDHIILNEIEIALREKDIGMFRIHHTHVTPD
jgi:tetratricopeptide (TPR) repeat protein